MSQLPVADQVRNALLQNENSGSYANAGTLTLSTGHSGYSVGAFQFDFAGNKTNVQALSAFQDMLQSTASTTGLTQPQINQIMQGITVAGGSPLISTALTQQINQAFQTYQGSAFITMVDTFSLSTAVQTVSNLIAAANLNPNGAGDLAYGNLSTRAGATAIAELAEYVNQFPPPFNQIAAYLSGGTAYIGPGNQPTSLGGQPVTLAALNAGFFSQTTQFLNNKANYDHFLSSATAAAQASSTGTIGITTRAVRRCPESVNRK